MKAELKGSALRVSAGISQTFSEPILVLVRRMADDVRKTVIALLDEHATDGFAMDASLSAQSRIQLNALRERYTVLFGKLSKRVVARMIDSTLRNSRVTLNSSLQQMSPGLSLGPDVMTERLKEITSAATNEAVSLIKLIPQQYLGEVQSAVNRSILGGTETKSLVAFLTEKYQQNVRHANLVAADQTRKVYNAVTAARMTAVGVKKFEWIHTGGTVHPRRLHKELNGTVWAFAEPPEIGEMNGQKVFGIPGLMPNCRCVMRPIITFGQDEDNE